MGECQGVLRDTGRQPPEQLTELHEIMDAPGRKHMVFTGALMERSRQMIPTARDTAAHPGHSTQEASSCSWPRALSKEQTTSCKKTKCAPVGNVLVQTVGGGVTGKVDFKGGVFRAGPRLQTLQQQVLRISGISGWPGVFIKTAAS